MFILYLLINNHGKSNEPFHSITVMNPLHDRMNQSQPLFPKHSKSVENVLVSTIATSSPQACTLEANLLSNCINLHACEC